MKKIQLADLWHHLQDRVLLDVRSPAEYAHAHIPNALNLPLFDDTERAKIGTLYKQVSPENALLKGLDFVGPKMAGFVKQAIKWSPERQLIIHCWRGGKRSGAMAWLMQFAGMDVMIVEGGYKSYRQYILQQFENQLLKVIILGGKTGSGKTLILKELEKQGEQIIDLEALAHHKGSAFGWIGEKEQPSVEQFENNVFEVFRHVDPAKRVWIENESRNIGSVSIPQGLWHQMKNAPLMHIEIPFQDRVNHLVNVYTQTSKEDLNRSFQKITAKLGTENLKKTITFIEDNDYENAAIVALKYYDKAYAHGFNKMPVLQKYTLNISEFDCPNTAESLIKWADTEGY